MKLGPNKPKLNDESWMREFVGNLFLRHSLPVDNEHNEVEILDKELFILNELRRRSKCLKLDKASGLDEIPNEVLKSITEIFPDMLLNLFNRCLSEHLFPKI